MIEGGNAERKTSHKFDLEFDICNLRLNSC